MGRPTIDEERRRELIQATFAAIHQAGLAEPSLSAICRCANIRSASIVLHYFGSKQALLEQAIRELARAFLGEVALRVADARSPKERVLAVIDANFAPSQCSPEVVSAWLWFWSRGPSNPAFAAIEQAMHRQAKAEIEAGLGALLPVQDVKDAADSLMALMYGLWLRLALDQSSLDVERARRIARDAFLSRMRAGEGSTAGPERT